MKSKKNIKKWIFKNKYVGLIVVVLLVVFAIVGVTKILGREVSVVCEDKKGNLFVPRDKDGKIDGCGKHGDAITFNFSDETNNGGDGSSMGSGEIAFIKSNYILKNDGTVWSYNMDLNTHNYSWSLADEPKIPVPVIDILQWDAGSFLTKDGSYYIYKYYGDSWIKVTDPIPTL